MRTALAISAALLLASTAQAGIEDQGVATLCADLASGRTSSEEVVRAF